MATDRLILISFFLKMLSDYTLDRSPPNYGYMCFPFFNINIKLFLFQNKLNVVLLVIYVLVAKENKNITKTLFPLFWSWRHDKSLLMLEWVRSFKLFLIFLENRRPEFGLQLPRFRKVSVPGPFCLLCAISSKQPITALPTKELSEVGGVRRTDHSCDWLLAQRRHWLHRGDKWDQVHSPLSNGVVEARIRDGGFEKKLKNA